VYIPLLHRKDGRSRRKNGAPLVALTVVAMGASISALSALNPASAGAVSKSWVSCGPYSNKEKRVAITTYSVRGVSCSKGLRVVLAARQRETPNSVVFGFRCQREDGEAESDYQCAKGSLGARAHFVAY
jgi:hypothetical protein